MAKPNFFWKNIGRALIALLFLTSGTLHFLTPGPFVKIVPPYFPSPDLLVAISGAAEICGAIGMLTSRFRRLAAYGLILLLVAVFPANVYMATAHIYLAGMGEHPWMLWTRLPLQLVLIAWVWVNRE